jgi:hypothetical protein
MQEAIRLMADCECFPLWKTGEERTADLDPENLPLSAETGKRLMNWAEWYDSTLNADDPVSSGFADKEDEQAFEEEGRSLCKTLRKELNGTYAVVYFSDSDTAEEKKDSGTTSYEVQRIYREILKLTIPEKMILVSKMLPDLSRELEKNVSHDIYTLKSV